MKDMTICDLDSGATYSVSEAPLAVIHKILEHNGWWSLEDHSVTAEQVIERCRIEITARGLEGRL